MLGSNVLPAVPLTPLDPVVLGFMLGCAAFGVYAALQVGRPLAGPVSEVVPYVCFLLICSPLSGRVEKRQAAAFAKGRSVAALRFEAAVAVLPVACAFLAGVRIGLALIGR